MLLEFQRNFAVSMTSPAEGPMRVYRNTVLSGCVDALRDNYPVVARLLGQVMFDAVAADYAVECPPRDPVLAAYGGCFSEWLEDQPWVLDLPYIPEVAEIERLYIEALFAADSDALSMEQFRGREDWQSLHLSLHPATRFAWFAGPAMQIWLVHQGTISGPIHFAEGAEGALFTRPHLSVEAMLLDGARHSLLFGIHGGESVSTAAAITSAVYPECDVGSLFMSLVNAGAFAALPHRSLP